MEAKREQNGTTKGDVLNEVLIICRMRLPLGYTSRSGKNQSSYLRHFHAGDIRMISSKIFFVWAINEGCALKVILGDLDVLVLHYTPSASKYVAKNQDRPSGDKVMAIDNFYILSPKKGEV